VLTLFQAFNSPAAQQVWNANQQPNAPTPTNPNDSGLLVAADAAGYVELLSPYTKNQLFVLSNSAIDGGSRYLLTAKEPGYVNPQVFMSLNSPDISVQIPGNIYGGKV
jgi:hypothetical protein